MLTKNISSNTRIANGPLGGPRNSVMDSRPAQAAPPTRPPTPEQIASGQKFLGKPKTRRFENAVRDAVRTQRLVPVHTCVSKLTGEGRCDCNPARLPESEAEILVFNGTHKWLETQRANGTKYRYGVVALATTIPETLVLVHACGLERERCYCSFHVQGSTALEMVGEGKAAWNQVERGDQRYEIHSAIVLSADEVAKLQAEARRQALPQTKPIAKFRVALADAVYAGAIAVSDAELSDDQIFAALQDPTKFCKTTALPIRLDQTGVGLSRALRRTSLSARFLQAVGWYWNKLIPTVSRYLFLRGAPQGRGRIVTGGYTTEKNGYLMAAQERREHGRKVAPGGFGADSDDEPDGLE